MRHTLRLAVMAWSLCLVAGCAPRTPDEGVSGQPAPEGSLTTGGAATGRAEAGATELTIVVARGPGRPGRTYTLHCDPPGGNHPTPRAACRTLADLEDPFAPVPAEAMCTEIYGGPQTATVTGTLRGEPVQARFDRTNGCQISRWDRHAAVLVVRGGVAGGDPAPRS